MNTIGRRIIGITMIIFAILSLVITVYGIYQIWQWREPLVENVSSTLDLVVSTLQATSEGLGTHGLLSFPSGFQVSPHCRET